MRLKVIVLFSVLSVSQILFAKVKLPKIFSDNMVLQRDNPVKIWGWSDRGEIVTVNFNQQILKAKADKLGYWEVVLKPMVYGGPFEMMVSDKSGQVLLHNILLGDVWICSGQSNMEMPIQGWGTDSVLHATKEIKAAVYEQIRFFTVEKAISYTPMNDLKGTWQTCSPGTAASFSAVAYFFGKKLHQDLHIPIGLINTSWGGTNIQSWISWDEMGKLDENKEIKLSDIQQREKKWAKNRQEYNAAIAKDAGATGKWYLPEINTASWKKITLPETFEQSEIGNVDGIIWFRKDFDVSVSQAGKTAALNLGAVDDSDETYLNGKLIGKTSNWSANRNYAIEKELLKAGKNSIVVKVLDTGGGGGFLGKEKDLVMTIGDDQITLSGEWLYKPSVITTQFDVHETGPNAFPSQLYNAMVAPLINFPMKGVIWYQGEANTSQAHAYQTLFPALINDWRSKWHNNFSFLWVQLANFMQPAVYPSESEWAELREAQHKALGLSKTGEAVIIDLGEANDIHPKNKHDVGFRLALAAQKIAYEKDILYSGPVFQSMDVKDNKVIISFTNQGSGLVAKNDKYGYLKGFAIAGNDQHFVWAKAYIEGDKVIIFSNEVKQPVAIRYGWGDNPDDANLYNKEGLPASPFRTDAWKGITENKK